MLGPTHLRDAIVASDPELARLRQAWRVTLTALVATLVIHAIATAIDRPTSVGLVGINVAMLGSAIVNDPTPRAQQLTLALAPVVASAAIVGACLCAPHTALRTALLLALVFVAVLVRRHGPRGLALGTISVLACFFALFFQATPAQLPLMISGVFLASALAFVVRFGLLRERPGAPLRRRIEGLRRTIAMTLYHLARAVADGPTPRRVARVQRHLGLVNEAALAIEELPDAPPGGRVLALELAVEEVALAARDWLGEGPPDTRQAVAAALLAARDIARAGEPTTLERALQPLSGPRFTWLVHALATLLTAIQQLEAPVSAGEAPTPAQPVSPPPAIATLRPAIQATVAAALALALGGLVASDRAFWAVLASFVVFTRANTLGAMLVRAWQRTVGTIAGVIVGLLVAELVQGHVYLELTLVFACMFVAYYTLQVAYGWTVGAFTTLVAVLSSLLGHFSPQLLYVRVLETIIGAGAGALVATLVFPAHTRPAIRGGMIEALAMLADHLELAMHCPTATRDRLRASARALDRKLRDLRTEVQRAAGGPSLRATRERARIFLAFATVCFHARPLAAAEWLAAATREPLRTVGLGLVDNARALADLLAGRGGPGVRPLAPELTAARAALTLETASAGDIALRWLAHLDAALQALEREVLTLDWAGPARH